MDPFSITAGAIGIGGVATTAIAQLHTAIGGYSGAHQDVQNILLSLEQIQAPLAALERLTIPDAAATARAREDLRSTGVANSVNASGEACSKLTKDLKRWTRHSNADELSFRDRFLIGLWNREKISTLKMQLQSCAQTLHLAVSATQLVVQLRSERQSERSHESVGKELKAIEVAIQSHMRNTQEQQAEANRRLEQLEETYDGATDANEAIAEVEKRIELLEMEMVNCGVVFAQTKSSRSGIDIGKVLTTDNSKAFVGLPPSVVGKVNLRVGEVTTQAGSTSHVGVFADNVSI
ncbi:hypothetical protein FB567DRAFT_542258 [Paraphoma chrysanthemicola]|uniref:Azaphilone pigments biosynthesis cluster protein L N-terminal domain-containing protein n=1 Tax=Paraphoma chrysanthemicola TaxID=798071 RepID=A0A8K0QSV2_9PLEO|nr:hypothetical protein FB567DRAFT_542258 [Paraphoma chrysanthemicola]